MQEEPYLQGPFAPLLCRKLNPWLLLLRNAYTQGPNSTNDGLHMERLPSLIACPEVEVELKPTFLMVQRCSKHKKIYFPDV